MDWMTPGGPTIAFLSNRELLAAVTCLNPDWVRCDAMWDGDAPLSNGGTALLDVLVACAVVTVKDRVEAGEPSDAIAKDVRWKFDLPPMRVSLAMKRGGLTMAEAHAAARSTMSAEELASHIKLNDEFWDSMESANEEAYPPPESSTEPWIALESDRARAFEEQARLEIASGHVLADLNLTAVSTCPGCDDVLFRLPDESFAIVHLTWRQGPEAPPFPTTVRLPGFLAVESTLDHHEHCG